LPRICLKWLKTEKREKREKSIISGSRMGYVGMGMTGGGPVQNRHTRL